MTEFLQTITKERRKPSESLRYARIISSRSIAETMTTMSIKGSVHEIPSGITIAEAATACGIRPDAYIFMIGGKPVPMDSAVPEEGEVRAIRVASGG